MVAYNLYDFGANFSSYTDMDMASILKILPSHFLSLRSACVFGEHEKLLGCPIDLIDTFIDTVLPWLLPLLLLLARVLWPDNERESL